MVGRIDCKAHRTKKEFEVLNLHLEDHCFKNKHIDHDHFLNALNALNDELLNLYD